MEEKNNTGLKIALILFIVLSLGLGGYIAYDKLWVEEAPVVEPDPEPAPEEIPEMFGAFVYDETDLLYNLKLFEDGSAELYVESRKEESQGNLEATKGTFIQLGEKIIYTRTQMEIEGEWITFNPETYEFNIPVNETFEVIDKDTLKRDSASTTKYKDFDLTGINILLPRFITAEQS